MQVLWAREVYVDRTSFFSYGSFINIRRAIVTFLLCPIFSFPILEWLPISFLEFYLLALEIINAIWPRNHRRSWKWNW